MKVNKTTFSIKQGDITQEVVDVIVNAANSGLLGGGGVDGAIHRAAGPSVLEECAAIRESQGKCPTGGAVITGAGNLRAKFIVHAVGPVWSGGERQEEQKLKDAYTNSLEVSARKGAKSIAFPAISTGAYRYPIKEAAGVALKVCADYAKSSEQFEEIRFILFSARDLRVYAEELAQLALE